jgi:O-antigen/teichoic acid export membrane protein
LTLAQPGDKIHRLSFVLRQSTNSLSVVLSVPWGIMKSSQSLGRRSVAAISWNAIASLTGVVVGLVRSILLARLLPIEVFGVYAFANSVVALTSPFPSFAMGGAFLHRAPETQDEDHAAAVHFTLKLIFTLIWAAVLVVGAVAFVSGQDRTALLALVVVGIGNHLTQTPELILIRRVVHRRLALTRLLNSLLSALITLGLAWRGVTLWALLSTNIVTLVVRLTTLYIWKPVWRPRLAWSTAVVRYYLSFGSQALAASLILRALDRVDDLWTRIFLGTTPLSFYSRAYRFATYPRNVLAAPINMVATGTYAELKGDRLRLSRAFFRVNALLVRTGFLLAGLLALVAPEFIRLLLGARWLPMLDAFRLMLVFTLLDPIKVTVGALFIAVGRPDQVLKARSIQLGVLVLGLFVLGLWLGIAGVALAVNIMLTVGMIILLRQARAYVDFSPWRLFVAPAVALTAGIAIVHVISTLFVGAVSDWHIGFAKTLIYTSIYVIVLLALERRQIIEMISFLRTIRTRSYPKPNSDRHS